MARTSLRKMKVPGIAIALILGLISIVFVASPAGADGTVVPGNKNCSDLIPGSLELRVEPVADGTFSNPDGFSVTIDVRTLSADDPQHSGNQTGSQVFDFTATGGSVIGVAVKGGPNTNFYDYRPNGVTSGTALHAPVASNQKFSGLSHISFCYVLKASPTIVTQVSNAEITIGSSVTDTATLSGGNNPTGTITFTVFGPDNADCSGTGTTVSTETVNGNGAYESDPFTPTVIGTYRWIAAYSGDPNNAPATTACNDANETVLVKKAQPTMTTVPNVLPNDEATLSGLVNPSGGTITFDLYLTADCSDTAKTFGTFDVNNNGTFKSNNTDFLVTADTVVSWIVTYSGDANNEGATSGCTAEQADINFTPLDS